MKGLIIAFIIIGFLYRAYKNFKKESEEAAKRAKDAEALQKATQQAKSVTYRKTEAFDRPVEQPYFETDYDRALVKEYKPVKSFDDNKQDYFKERAKAKQHRDSKSPKKPVLDNYNPEKPADEVIAGRRIHKPHQHGIKIKTKEKHLATDFNFRQALIYDAVFRRPEY